MLKRYIKDIVKTELIKQKLNDIYGKVSEDSWEHRFHNQVNYTETLVNKKDREILKLREKNKKLIGSKEFLKTSLMEASEYVKSLEQEKELLKESIENLEGKLILKGNLLSEQKQQNEQLKEKIKWLKNDKDVLLKQVSQQYEEYEKLEQKNLKLKEENAKSKLSSLGNDYEKQILEDKLLRIYKTIEENYYQDGYYELLRIKNIIDEILKES